MNTFTTRINISIGLPEKSAYQPLVNAVFRDNLSVIGILLMLALGPVFAASKPISTPLNENHETNMRSFHETTELAEVLWAELTTRFVEFYENGDYIRAQKIAEQAYWIADNNFGINSTNTADSLLKLGIINQTQGNLPAAENYLLDALLILKDQLGSVHADIAVVHTNLGNLYFELEEYRKSRQHHEQALHIRQHVFGDHGPAVAQSIYNLAVLYEQTYEQTEAYEKANPLYRKAIELWTKAFGPTHPYVVNATDNLINILVTQERFAEATDIQLYNLDIKKTIYGARHAEVAQSLVNLGTLYIEQSRYDQAATIYEEALDVTKHILAPHDPQLALLMYTLANIYHVQARMALPENTYTPHATPAKTAQQNIGAANDTKTNITGITKIQVADIQTVLLFNHALPLYERAVAILDTDHNSHQPTLQVVLSELAQVYKALGATDKALATESRLHHIH